jgi:hypothetical protein
MRVAKLRTGNMHSLALRTLDTAHYSVSHTDLKARICQFLHIRWTLFILHSKKWYFKNRSFSDPDFKGIVSRDWGGLLMIPVYRYSFKYFISVRFYNSWGSYDCIYTYNLRFIRWQSQINWKISTDITLRFLQTKYELLRLYNTVV